jgi:aminoglycoside phosphotransferase family enzyme/predicted kinase
VPTELTADDAARLAEALRRNLEAASGHPHALVETHISRVLLGPEFAYKLKKPVRLGFLDFGTQALRRRACEEELRLNGRLAPQLYLDVVDVHGPPGAASLSGGGEVIDCAVRMRRFADDAQLLHRLEHGESLSSALDEFAARLAAFQAVAPAASPSGPWGTPAGVVAAVRAALQGARAALGEKERALSAWVEQQATQAMPMLAQRLQAGKVREGHGDLHLANLVSLADGITAFDCIEFDPALRWIDVLSDAAFLVMDLCAHERADLGYRFLNAYLDHSGEHEGLALLRLYLVYRALVRAQVELLRAGQAGGQADPRAARYLALAVSMTQAGRPRLLITHGLPGSGKTFLSQQLLERCGAVRLRSDVERKRLYGLGPLQTSAGEVPEGIYGPEATRRTYERLEQLARIALGAGYPTIVDAAFLRRDERDRFAALAQEAGCPFAVLQCEAPLDLLRSRVRARHARRDDASEADVDVLERLHAVQQPLDLGERSLVLRGGNDADMLAANW